MKIKIQRVLVPLFIFFFGGIDYGITEDGESI